MKIRRRTRKSAASYLRRHAAALFGLSVIVLLSVELYALHCEVHGRLILPHILYALVEISFLSAPYWWLRGRLRMLALVPAWALSALMFCSAVYFRFYGCAMPFALISQAGNADSVLLSSVSARLRCTDAVFLLCPAWATAALCIPAARAAIIGGSIALRTRLAATIGACALYAAMQLKLTLNIYPDILSAPDACRMIRGHFTHPGEEVVTSHIYLLSHHGLLVHTVHEINHWVRAAAPIRLSATERESLRQYLDAQSRQRPATHFPKGKNLIFIIVESLNADVIDLSVNGREITPVLNALCRDSASVSCTSVVPQTGMGVSSDGQLLYNLGLLPSPSCAAGATRVPQMKALPALSAIVPDNYSTAAFFSESGTIWSEARAYEAYGYKQIHTAADYCRSYQAAGHNDQAMFDYAARCLGDMPQPFCVQMLTVDTHVPFDDSHLPPAADYTATGYSETFRRYLNCVAEFDRLLGRFIADLKHSGLWDNTVLVIASDHNAPLVTAGDGRIVFIAACCGSGMRVERSTRQADVFPTLLDIMGVDSDYRGVGRSMLCPPDSADSAGSRAAAVSDSILRSDFFDFEYK